jgi:hypothetical protein
MTDYAAVLSVLYPDAEWSLNANDFSTLQWGGDGAAPSQAECDAAWPQVQWQQEHDAVRETRQHLYATETDPMFFEVQRGEGTATLQDWKDAVQAIKDAHPFPTDVD